MASKIPPIGKVNYIAIAGMEPGMVFKVREYYIVRIVSARRSNDSDTIEVCLDWIVALTAEMRIRGGSQAPQPEPAPGVIV